MKPIALLFPLLLVACSVSDPAAPTARRLDAPSFALDLTPPPAPTAVSAVLDSIGQPCAACDARAFLTVSWTDNTTDADESNTCGAFVDTTTALAMGSGCAYASDYDTPPGSTGTRQSRPGEFVAVPGGPYRLSIATTRRIVLADGRGWNVTGPSSDPITVDASGTATTASVKRKGHR
jgi:hypothetical protein